MAGRWRTCTYTIGTTITEMVFPEASGGNGELRYSLEPVPPGLTWDAVNRRLSGTPTEAGTWIARYSVEDSDDDSDVLLVTIIVKSEEPNEPDELENDDPPDEPERPRPPRQPTCMTGCCGCGTNERACYDEMGGQLAEGNHCGCACDRASDSCRRMRYRWRRTASDGSSVPCTRQGGAGCRLVCTLGGY